VLTPVFEGALSLFRRVRDAVAANQESFTKFADLIRTYIAPVIGTVLGGALKALGVIAQGVINIVAKAADFIRATVEVAIAGINALIRAYNAIPALPNIPTINAPSAGVTAPSAPSIRAIERGVPSASAAAAPVAPVTNNITVNGAIDSESTARQIARVLTESASRGTGGGGGFLGGVLVT